MAAVEVDVQVACKGNEIPSQQTIRDWVGAAVTGGGMSGPAEISVRVVDADEIRTLNGLYRQQDKPTNVLSFPAGKLEGLPEGETSLLGDVVVCASVVTAEAEDQGKALADHWAHMLVHGTLHLLGYDHETTAQAAEMEHLEAQILSGRGIANPYAGQ